MSVQAVQYDCFGPVENLKLANVPGENPEEGQVKIAVHAVGLNPVDYKIFEGAPQLRMLSRVMKIRNPRRWFESKKSQFPRGIGRDFSGTVLEVGPGVSGYHVGDEVFGTIVSAPGLGTKRGSLATEICVNTGDIALKPASIDFDHAAAMGVAALTVGGWRGCGRYCGHFCSLGRNWVHRCAVCGGSWRTGRRNRGGCECRIC